MVRGRWVFCFFLGCFSTLLGRVDALAYEVEALKKQKKPIAELKTKPLSRSKLAVSTAKNTTRLGKERLSIRSAKNTG